MSGLNFLAYKRNHYSRVTQSEILSIRKRLATFTSKERKDLAYFINQVTAFDQFSYTLIGYKPLSISQVIVEDTEDLTPFFKEAFYKSKNQILRRGFIAWKKYQILFPNKTDIFIDYSFLGTGRKEIAVICPVLCKAMIQEHLQDFQEILGKPYKSEELFWILTHPEHEEFYSLVDHTRLIGILLGFGRENAHLYEQHCGGSSRSVIANQRQPQDSLRSFNDERFFPGKQLSPDFICNPSSKETEKLKDHYKEADKIIQWTYFLRSNVEVALALIYRS